MKLTIALLLVLINISSCKVKSRIASSENQLGKDNEKNILFLNFNIEKDSSKIIKITLLKNFWVTGSFKEIEHQLKLEDGILEFEFLDNNQRLLKKILVENPLTASYEDFSPDGTIERKQVRLKEAELTIRINISKVATYIRISNSNGTINLIEL